MIHILKPCERELRDFPADVKADLADALTQLEEGDHLSMPLSRPMPGIGKGVHELRFRDRAGVFRVIYFLAGADGVFLLHAFMKKSEGTPRQNIETARRRLREIQS